jgi:hypothetical protein
MGGVARPDGVLVTRALRYVQRGWRYVMPEMIVSNQGAVWSFSGRSDRAQRWLKKGRGHRGR